MTSQPEIHAFAHGDPARAAEHLTGGVVAISGTIGRAVTAASVAEALRLAPPGPVTVRINSAGGRAIEGIAIWALLRVRGCHVIIDGIAASAASLIAMAGTVIEMAPSALLMIHRSHLALGGDAGDFRDAGERLAACDAIYSKIYADRTGKALAEIEALTARETWLSPAMAIELGFAHRIGEDDALSWPAQNAAEPRICRERLTIGDAHQLASPGGAQAFYRVMVASEGELERAAFAASPEMVWALTVRDKLRDRQAEPSAEVWLEARPLASRMERAPSHFGEEFWFDDETRLMTAEQVKTAWRAAAADMHLVRLLIRNRQNQFCEALWLGQDALAAEIRAETAHLLRVEHCIELSLQGLALRQSKLTTRNLPSTP